MSIYNDFEKGLKYKEIIQKYNIKQWLAQDIKLKKGIFKDIIESDLR